MNAPQVLSFLGNDKFGVFPSQKYFKERGSSIIEKLVLLEFFIQTNQIQKEIVLSVYNKLKENGWKSLSDKQWKVLLTSVESTYNTHLSSATHLYIFPSLVEYEDSKKSLNNSNYLKEKECK